MNKLSRVVLLSVLVAGCRSKSKDPGAGASSGSQAAPSTAWLERLPQVEGGDKNLVLNRAAGLVEIKADGSIHIAPPPATRPADPRKPSANPLAGATPVQLPQLTQKLSLPAVSPRRENALTAEAPPDGAGEGRTVDAFALLGHPAPASGAPAPPKRVTSAFGVVHDHDVSAGVIVFADAKAPASVLVDVLAQTGGFVAVRRGDELGALSLAFDRQTPPLTSPVMPWLEARLGKVIEVERVPSKPTTVAAIDKLGEAVTPTAMKAVDVLVAPETTVQELVAAIGGLRDAKVAALGFGRVPDGDAASGRGDQGPRVIAWNFERLGAGATDATAVRAAFDSRLAPMRTCYTKVLAAAPDLAGTAQLQLSVTPTGVATVNIAGVPVVLAKCITTAIKAAAFPRDPGGMRAVATLAFLPS